MKKILVVDDEFSIVEVWKEILELSGHEVSTANNGNNGVELIAENDFDMIITDMKMPGSDGLVILDYISKSEKNPKMVVSSGYVEYDNILSKYNVDMFIQKPFLLEKEIDNIRELLGINFSFEKST